jgi:DtxR family Mn-dependent transcriptional regulator
MAWKNHSEPLTSSLEDYLEAIFALERENKSARSKDIAERLGVQRGSVTGALQTLAQKGLIHYHPYSKITLTPEGFRLATRIVYRHKALFEFLHTFLQLSEDLAESNACRLEHHIDDEALDRLIAFVQFVRNCPRTGSDWLAGFTRMCADCSHCAECEACIASCLESFREQHSS